MSDKCQILSLIPLAWGADALDMALGAAQSLARSCGVDYQVVLLGASESAPAVARAAAAEAGAVFLAEHAGLSDADDLPALALVAAAAVGQLAAEPGVQRLILLPPGADGEELAARLAVELDACALGRCSALSWSAEGLVVERATWGGRLRLVMGMQGDLAVACLRTSKPQLTVPSTPHEVRRLPVQLPLPAALALEESISGQRLPPVESARIVVSGGRGLNEQGFALLEDLAERLDGSLGGSLPAVDAGLVPVVRQVGVSGKFVSPDIYLAVGISGTPQHLAGISPDSRIFAINKDASADIFNVAQVGVVGEWEQLLPALLKALEQ
ncbi:electron transfer flavoprotein subunit alpha [Pseudomonas taeanensis MS-3]|uniref:Electron transfer flavoprotein subunit alpha n=1 Tax=Pseudomonas taeanensis MS-3 TaxID=1395571 RepID=A0A0A1YL03_9PSED|nr:electron transfer flavoprotein subunit alpha/FixB family protein [Pseudomonas taeanensis]KFX69638.1 electron transfer flavoprotein subunit alpha [Pseudomonas taeanensis MS-3]